MNRIRQVRTNRSISQKRLASDAQIDPRTLRKIEKGETVSLESFRSVCSVLGIDPAETERAETVFSDGVTAIGLDKGHWTNALMPGVLLLMAITPLAGFLFYALVMAPRDWDTEIVLSGVALEQALVEERVDRIEALGMRYVAVRPSGSDGNRLSFQIRGRLDPGEYAVVASALRSDDFDLTMRSRY